MTTRFERLLSLAGIAAGLVWAGTQTVTGAILTGDVPDASKHPARAVQFLVDHDTQAVVVGIGAGYLCVLILFFAAAVRRALGDSAYATAAFGGGVALAISQAYAATSTFGMLAAAEDGNRAAVTTLWYADQMSWLPWAAASGAFLLAAGFGALKVHALPRWLAVTTVILGVLSITGPTGMAVYLVSPLWFVAAGLVLYRRTAPASAPIPAQAPVGTLV